MYRRTLSNALASRIPESLNLNRTDARVVQFINAAIQRLLVRGHWIGTTPKYKVSVTDQLLTLPPQFATIEKIAVAQSPIALRNQWFEFYDLGYGVVNDPTADCPDSGTGQALLRGIYPTNKDLTTGRKLRLQCDVATDVGETVLALGYDSSGNWVRTNPGGVWQDGETIVLAQNPGTLSATTWSRITDLQKPVTDGQIWAYDWDGASNVLISTYQYWETNPGYQRYLLPIVPATATQVDLIGKLAFMPVTNPTDYLIIPNLEALRLACMSVKLEEAYKMTEASLYMNGGKLPNGQRFEGAVTLLQDELEHFQGGATPVIEVIGSNLTGDLVENIL